jgi:hypothetical protein
MSRTSSVREERTQLQQYGDFRVLLDRHAEEIGKQPRQISIIAIRRGREKSLLPDPHTLGGQTLVSGVYFLAASSFVGRRWAQDIVIIFRLVE